MDVDWAHVEQLVSAPVDWASAARLYTPPVVVPSRLISGTHASSGQRGSGTGSAVGDLGSKGKGRGSTQMLAVQQGAAGVQPGGVKVLAGLGSGPDKMVDLVYDPVLNCYYDQITGSYFELNP